eukprot:358864-Chlamydomonas_euryale.AAC.7
MNVAPAPCSYACTFPRPECADVCVALSAELAARLGTLGAGVAANMGEWSLRWSLDLAGLVHLRYDFQVWAYVEGVEVGGRVVASVEPRPGWPGAPTLRIPGVGMCGGCGCWG